MAKLESDGEFAEQLFVHGLGVQTAEGLAEWLHAKAREMLAIPSTQGRRYSWGYPAVPEQAEHLKVERLLGLEQIGMQISDGYAPIPEQSTLALVAHHPQAIYFGTRQGRLLPDGSPDDLIKGSYRDPSLRSARSATRILRKGRSRKRVNRRLRVAAPECPPVPAGQLVGPREALDPHLLAHCGAPVHHRPSGDQLDRQPAGGVARGLAGRVLGHALGSIVRPAGVERAVAAAQQVDPGLGHASKAPSAAVERCPKRSSTSVKADLSSRRCAGRPRSAPAPLGPLSRPSIPPRLREGAPEWIHALYIRCDRHNRQNTPSESRSGFVRCVVANDYRRAVACRTRLHELARDRRSALRRAASEAIASRRVPRRRFTLSGPLPPRVVVSATQFLASEAFRSHDARQPSAKNTRGLWHSRRERLRPLPAGSHSASYSLSYQIVFAALPGVAMTIAIQVRLDSPDPSRLDLRGRPACAAR